VNATNCVAALEKIAWFPKGTELGDGESIGKYVL
jgi:hypothetical protein